MVRLSLAAAAFAATLPLAAPLAAQTDLAAMTDTERSALRAEVRAYLMENPEVIFEAVAEFERRNQRAQADMDTALVEINAEDIFRDGHSWVTGNPEGDITLVEFMDYRCGYCRRAQPQVMDLIGSDGNIRLVVKEFPILGPQSEVMSRFAVSVQQLGGDTPYAAVHEQLMGWEGDLTEADMRAIAGELGLDAEAVLAGMNSAEVNAILQENYALAQRLQITGTPTFVMGDGSAGELLRGFLPAAEMARVAAGMRG